MNSNIYLFIVFIIYLFLLHYPNPKHVFCLVNIFSNACNLQTELMSQSSTEVCLSVEFNLQSLKLWGYMTTSLLKHTCRPPQDVAHLLILWIPTDQMHFLCNVIKHFTPEIILLICHLICLF